MRTAFDLTAARFREVPWLWVPAGLLVLSLAAHVAMLVVLAAGAIPPGGSGWGGVAVGVELAAILAAVVALGFVGRRFHPSLRAADDLASPIRGESREIHPLDAGLRLVATRREKGDVAAVVAFCAVLALSTAGIEAAAFAVLAWTLGFPRRRRVVVEIPWDSIRHGRVESKNCFLLVHGEPARVEFVLARYTQGTRFEQALAARLGDRWAGQIVVPPGGTAPPLPGIETVEAADPDTPISALVADRIRERRFLVVVLGFFVVALVALLAGRLTKTAALLAAGNVLLLVGAITASFIRGKRAPAWARPRPEPGDSAAPLPATWTNRPGWPGGKGCQVHLGDEQIRVVGREVEMWDLLVYVAAVLVVGSAGLYGAPAGGGGTWGVMGVTALLAALGLPRMRRVVADVRWQDIERAEVRLHEFTLRTTLPEPLHELHLTAAYGVRDTLRDALRARIGERCADVSTPPRRADREMPPPGSRNATLEDLDAAAQRLRDARRG